MFKYITEIHYCKYIILIINESFKVKNFNYQLKFKTITKQKWVQPFCKRICMYPEGYFYTYSVRFLLSKDLTHFVLTIMKGC